MGSTLDSVELEFITVQFSWGPQTFRRSTNVQNDRVVYRSCGHTEDDNDFKLAYNSIDDGHWAVERVASGWMYRVSSASKTLDPLLGKHLWVDCSGQSVELEICAGKTEADGF